MIQRVRKKSLAQITLKIHKKKLQAFVNFIWRRRKKLEVPKEISQSHLLSQPKAPNYQKHDKHRNENMWTMHKLNSEIHTSSCSQCRGDPNPAHKERRAETCGESTRDFVTRKQSNHLVIQEIKTESTRSGFLGEPIWRKHFNKRGEICPIAAKFLVFSPTKSINQSSTKQTIEEYFLVLTHRHWRQCLRRPRFAAGARRRQPGAAGAAAATPHPAFRRLSSSSPSPTPPPQQCSPRHHALPPLKM
jgi:hypothetical protein